MKILPWLLFMTTWMCVCKAYSNDLIVEEISFPEATKLSDNTLRMPFKFAGRLITVQAKVNGESGPFIIDTGSYGLVLNKRIYNKIATAGRTTYSIEREIPNVQGIAVYSFNIDGFKINSKNADVVDLSHIEKEKHTAINGIIGYDTFRRFELYIDFYLEQITFFKIDRKGNRIDEKYLSEQIVDTLSFKRRKHSIILDSNINDIDVTFVLDTGAEINQLSNKLDSLVYKNFQPLKRLELMGMDGGKKEVIAGVFKNLKFTNAVQNEEMPTVLSTMTYAANAYGTQVDGVLGFWFLRNRRVLINYRKKKLFFTKWPE
ncbi:aspartyl protease family protein [Nonlabens sp. SY33080]|uniref:aspartyl protease family protein n=1 Tax=Nonlabens sp. SY33080 TaxID=2719911 RepID=UPI001428CA2E|nr:aspartyl protease family protein [Nonlabens sp. SY33080]